MAKAKLIRVYANPYGSEPDHEGRAHCHVHYEPSANGDAGMRFVGCRLVATQIGEGPAPNVFGATSPHDVIEFDHVWEYDTEPTIVPLTAYYMAHLRQHGHHGPALLPADKESWAAVHGDDGKGFIHPHRRLAQFHVERGHAPTMKGHQGHPSAPPSESSTGVSLHADAKPAVPHHVAHFRTWLGKHHDDAVAHDELRRNAKMVEAPAKVAPPDQPTTPDSPQAIHAAYEPEGA